MLITSHPLSASLDADVLRVSPYEHQSTLARPVQMSMHGCSLLVGRIEIVTEEQAGQLFDSGILAPAQE